MKKREGEGRERGGRGEGDLLLGLPVLCSIPVQRFDFVFLQSSKVFHKSVSFSGWRISFSMSCKRVTKMTAKGNLKIDKDSDWALNKSSFQLQKNNKKLQFSDFETLAKAVMTAQLYLGLFRGFSSFFFS